MRFTTVIHLYQHILIRIIMPQSKGYTGNRIEIDHVKFQDITGQVNVSDITWSNQKRTSQTIEGRATLVCEYCWFLRIKWLFDVVILIFLQPSAAGVHLIQKSATYGLKDSPAPVFLRAMRATASLTSMDRCALSSPSPPAFAKTEHFAPYWKELPIPSQGVE